MNLADDLKSIYEKHDRELAEHPSDHTPDERGALIIIASVIGGLMDGTIGRLVVESQRHSKDRWADIERMKGRTN